jgi:hypothetical protein
MANLGALTIQKHGEKWSRIELEKDLVVKVIFSRKADYDKVVKALERDFNVAQTSRAILEEETQKYHIFLALFEKVK